MVEDTELDFYGILDIHLENEKAAAKIQDNKNK